MNDMHTLAPLLVVRDAPAAIDFYVTALGARERRRFINRELGVVSHADLELHGAVFSVTEELPGFDCDAPPTVGGSPVVMQVWVDDVEQRVARLLSAGASEVFPMADFCGERMARVRDPFGHGWIVSQRVEPLSTREKQRRLDALFAELARGNAP